MIHKIKDSRGRGFTLVELLAVIVILAIILVIAVPKVMSVIEDAKKATLESTAKMIASQAEKQKVQNTVLGNNKKITCKDITNINDVDYASCSIEFEDDTAKVTIAGSGKFEGLYVCGGDKTTAIVAEEECTGGGVQVLNCTFDGELVQGAEFVHNQYIYSYKQWYHYDEGWQNMEQDGWGAILTDSSSTAPVNTPICTYINGKPVVSMSYMFYNANARELDLSLWNTSNVTDMTGMFDHSKAISIDLSSFNTSNVTGMTDMFFASAATSLDLSNFDTSNVKYMNGMFSDSAATSIDLSSFDTSNVTNMYGMFENSAATSLDLSSFDTSNVTNMYRMFSGSAATSLDLSSFNTSNVTDMSWMFSGSAATSLDLSSFNTSNVTDMSSMFAECGVSSIDLSGFDTSNVTKMSEMFSDSAANTIYVGNNWNTTNVTNSYHMFGGATNLVGGNGTTYIASYIDKTYARVDTASTPGYFTYKASN